MSLVIFQIGRGNSLLKYISILFSLWGLAFYEYALSKLLLVHNFSQNTINKQQRQNHINTFSLKHLGLYLKEALIFYFFLVFFFWFYVLHLLHREIRSASEGNMLTQVQEIWFIKCDAISLQLKSISLDFGHSLCTKNPVDQSSKIHPVLWRVVAVACSSLVVVCCSCGVVWLYGVVLVMCSSSVVYSSCVVVCIYHISQGQKQRQHICVGLHCKKNLINYLKLKCSMLQPRCFMNSTCGNKTKIFVVIPACQLQAVEKFFLTVLYAMVWNGELKVFPTGVNGGKSRSHIEFFLLRQTGNSIRCKNRAVVQLYSGLAEVSKEIFRADNWKRIRDLKIYSREIQKRLWEVLEGFCGTQGSFRELNGMMHKLICHLYSVVMSIGFLFELSVSLKCINDHRKHGTRGLGLVYYFIPSSLCAHCFKLVLGVLTSISSCDHCCILFFLHILEFKLFHCKKYLLKCLQLTFRKSQEASVVTPTFLQNDCPKTSTHAKRWSFGWSMLHFNCRKLSKFFFSEELNTTRNKWFFHFIQQNKTTHNSFKGFKKNVITWRISGMFKIYYQVIRGSQSGYSILWLNLIILSHFFMSELFLILPPVGNLTQVGGVDLRSLDGTGGGGVEIFISISHFMRAPSWSLFPLKIKQTNHVRRKRGTLRSHKTRCVHGNAEWIRSCPYSFAPLDLATTYIILHLPETTTQTELMMATKKDDLIYPFYT
ncbi:hypothetical protein VP01_1225g4 [Puccinia sorghi]|uniref:Uncharacterized protein n=1 Tax=Puccinia sorghi TaxID=27349 RepID=A0A0L6VPW9_9BASI|nr:hypothetical protein VP01_1225g4 [Puccinia sorghi]